MIPPPHSSNAGVRTNAMGFEVLDDVLHGVVVNVLTVAQAHADGAAVAAAADL
jgi:hypothetical protein